MSEAQFIDFITGCAVPNCGAEANRQAMERRLVETKGYRRQDIAVDRELVLTIDGEPYASRMDLLVSVDGRAVMVIKCAAGSLGSREREVVAAARLAGPVPVPLAVVSDGVAATVIETATGRIIGEDMAAVPSRAEAFDLLASYAGRPLSPDRLAREKLIFRTYDQGNVNVARKRGAVPGSA